MTSASRQPYRPQPSATEVIGHRGYARPDRPENTLAAMVAALRAGAHGVEVDIRLTANGVAVCWHDADLVRVAGDPRDVRLASYAELLQVALPGGHRIATLAEVIAAVAGRGLLILDLKPDPRPIELVDAIVACLDGSPPVDVVVSSTEPELLDALAWRAPHLARAPISAHRESAEATLRSALRRADAAIHLDLTALLAAPDVVTQSHLAGLTVRAWTVNRPVDAQLLELIGVDSLITDDPALLLARRPVAV